METIQMCLVRCVDKFYSIVATCISWALAHGILIHIDLKDHMATAKEAACMVHRSTSRRSKAKANTMLRLPDLEHSKTAVPHSLGAASSQESYCHAIDEFIGWYCSEPRLAFNRIKNGGGISHPPASSAEGGAI